MDATKGKQMGDNQQPESGSLKKQLAVATMAAALGVSLGVGVGDVLAANEQLSSPPNVSKQDKHSMMSTQHKDNQQVQQSKQLKINQSKQLKMDQSKQLKLDQPK